jgi:peptidoglycan-associated lipoprotein
MGKAIGYLLITTLIISLAGCKFAPVKKRGGGEEGGAVSSETEAGRASGIEAGGPLDIKALNDPASPLSKRVLYFELDSSQISNEDREIIAAHARFLAAHPDISIVLEGHADERGTREYNLALGERRAKAVQQLLVLQGVDPKQVQVISFGEERPVALDHNESAWRLNRRVEILYSGY